MSRRIVALLPMKAHSERVRGKNFRDFNGKPLFRWILDALLAVDDIDYVVINTDARSILEENGLSESDRIIIRDRLDELCGDLVSMNHILADDIANIHADVYLMTHTTHPLLSSDTISAAITAYQENEEKFDSLFSVNKFQTRFYRKDGSAVNHDPAKLVRTQDLEPWFEENSNIYIFTRDSFYKTGARIGITPMMFETPQLESFDIDTPEDWQVCEIVCKHLVNSQSTNCL